MKYCLKCGVQLHSDAKFCSHCGAPVEHKCTNVLTQRREEYAGTIIKCPACGEPLYPSAKKCFVCGLEMAKVRPANTVRDFIQKIEETRNLDQKISLIKNYQIPNTKEDILEFMALATSNVDLGAYSLWRNDRKTQTMNDAWDSKIVQTYSKAMFLFPEEPAFNTVQKLYDEFHHGIPECKKKSTRNLILILIGEFVFGGGMIAAMIFLANS